MHRFLWPAVILLPLVACGSSPTEPSGNGGGSSIVQGQTVSAVDGSASPNLTVQVGTRSSTSDSNGFFQVDVGSLGTNRAVIRGNSVVERETRITTPRSDPTRVTLIPSSFDLAAFDEMFRNLNSRLERWTSRPALVILAAVMDHGSGSANSYEASSEQLTDEEISLMMNQLTEGLAMLTGNTYGSFASVEIERPAAGSKVNVMRPGTIVVGRYTGIVTFGGRTIGYGQWAEQPDGSINAGATFLDRDFDRGNVQRRLLRIHELGHALGYQHVNSRTSIMNPAVGPDVQDFDRSGALIAFQRPLGNRSPDIDPTSTTLPSTSGLGKVAGPSTPCR